MADEFTILKLKEWKLDKFIDKFKDECIDSESLMSLTELMIKNLIPQIRYQAKLLKGINELKTKTSINPGLIEITNQVDIDFEGLKDFPIEILNDNVDSGGYIQSNTANTEHSYIENVLIKESSLNVSTSNKVNNEIENILNLYSDGKMILKYFKLNKKLSNSMRNILSTVLIKNELKNDPELKINKIRFETLSQGIEQLFNSEIKSTYFIGYSREGSKTNKGKLYDKYCNIRKEIKKISPVIDTSTKNHQHGCSPNVVSDEFNEEICWLKNNIEPNEMIYSYWKLTSPYRLGSNIENSLSVFPALTQSSLGPSLIESDFNYLYPSKSMAILTKFELFIQHLRKYIDDYDINFGTKGLEYIAELNNPNKPGKYNDTYYMGNEIYAALWLLPLIFQPVCIKHNKHNNKRSSWRPSKVEQACSFIRFINNINDVKNTHESIVKKALTYGLTVQPYILIVGSIFEDINFAEHIQSFVVINSTKYKLETPLKAVDTCFKSFFTLNYKYPVEGEQVWTFIQKYFFEIDTKNDKCFPQMNTIINDLK